MSEFIRWCAFLGGWLLFAGPLYQAALELGEGDVRRSDLEAATSSYVPPPRIAPWWWLFPPVGYWKQRQRTEQVRRDIIALWTPEQRESFVEYANKATGWALVAAGAILIAAKETWELVEHYEWPTAIFWVLAAFMALLSAAFTSIRLTRTREIVKK
jgi:hypothetical protein